MKIIAEINCDKNKKPEYYKSRLLNFSENIIQK